jgi:type VI protein secretion system component Hcp
MNSVFRCFQFAAVVFSIQVAALRPAFAVEMYLNIGSINGEDDTPGYPDSMAASRVTIEPNAFSIIKELDSASPALALSVANGTPLGTAKMLFYNMAPAGPPDASLNFFSTIASSYQLLGGTEEEVGFNAANPLQLYLEVPGIPGESNTPGHPNVMQIHSWSLYANDFTIVKQQDTASDDLLLANALGTHFPAARLLLYDSLPLGAAPDAVIEFEDVLVSSSQGGPGQLEEHTFNFATLAQIPEPSSLALLVVATVCAVHATRRQTRCEISARLRTPNV